jgi:hypothetical protein
MDVPFYGCSNDTIECLSDPGCRRYCCLLKATSLFLTSRNLAITENPRQEIIAGVIDTEEQLIAAGDKHSFVIISAHFRKNLKQPQWNTQGPGGH